MLPINEMSGATRQSKIPTIFMIMFASTLLLGVFFFLYHANRLHFVPSFINDQVHYIGLARHLIDYGHLAMPGKFPGTGNIIYLGFLKVDGAHLYVPGYYSLLALSFWLFGYSSITALLPSMLSYVLCTILVFYIAQKLYNQQVALMASLIFMLIPMNIFYALIAMTEMSFACVCIAMFALLVALPEKYRAWAIPFLLVLPYLFRQTAVFLIFPMLAYCIDNKSIRTIFQAALIIIFSILVLRIINIWQVSEGLRQVPFLDYILHGHINYHDVNTAAEHHFSLGQLIQLIFKHTVDNIQILIDTLLHQKILPKLTRPMFYLSFLMTALCFYYGWLVRKKTLLPIAISIMVMALIGMLTALYSANFNKIIRHAMYCMPFLSLTMAAMFYDEQLSTNWLFKRVQVYKYVLLSVLIFLFFLGNIHAAKHLREGEIRSQQHMQFLESIHPDYNKVIVAPSYASPEFIVKHYPTLVSFVPNNDASLVELNKHYPIGTVILNEYDKQFHLSSRAMSKIGLKFKGIYHFGGARWKVYSASKIRSSRRTNSVSKLATLQALES